MGKIQIIVEEKALKNAIVSFGQKDALRDSEIHMLACSAVAHAYSVEGFSALHMLDKLHMALGRSTNKDAFIRWTTEYIPCSYSKEKGVFQAAKKTSDKYKEWADKEYTFDSCQDLYFWDFKKGVEVKALDVKKRIIALLKSIDERQEEINTGMDKGMLVCSGTMLAQLRKLVQ